MAQHSKVNKPNQKQDKQLLVAQICESYGRVVYTHKTHEKAADIYFSRLRVIKFFQIFLSALTTGSLLYHLFNGNKVGTIIAAVFSIILLVLNIYTKEYNLAELSQRHHDTAQRIWNIREAYLNLITDLKTDILSINDVLQKRESLQEKLNHIYTDAPRTFKLAYEQARKALHLHEEMTFSEDEINLLLPEKMRK